MTAPFLSTTSTPAAQPQAPASPAPQQFVSPAYKSYMLQQAASIRAAGGGDEDVKQFFHTAVNRPGNRRGWVAFPETTVDSVFGDSTPDNLRGVSMALLQGGTLGFGDEAMGAALGKLTGVGARGGIDQYRREYEDWYAQHPKLGPAMELTGTILGALVGSAELGAGVGATEAVAPTILGGLGRGMVKGAAAGAISGAGSVNSDDLSWNMVGDRMKGAVLGGAVGAGTGGLIGATGAAVAPYAATAINKLGTTDFVQNIAKKVADVPVLGALENITPTGRAMELVSKFAKSRDLDAATLLQRAQGFWAQGQRPTIVDIMGPEFTEFARGVLKEQTGGVREVINALEQRQISSGDRLIGNLLMRSLSNPKLGTENYNTLARSLRNQARSTSEPLFAKAHDQVVPLSAADKARFTPDVIEAWNHGAGIANGEVETGLSKGLKVPLLSKAATPEESGAFFSRLADMPIKDRTAALEAWKNGGNIPDELPVRGFDYLRRSSQEPINARFKKGNVEMTPQTQQLYDRELATMDARVKPLTQLARDRVPVYGQALDTYSGPMQSRDALMKGYRDFKKKVSPDEVTQNIASLQPSDRDYYRLGAVRAHAEAFQKGGRPLANVAAQQFGGALLKFDKSGKLIGRVNDDAARAVALFPGNPQGAQDFLRVIAGEANLSSTVNRALSLPKQVSTQKLEESSVGAPLPGRGSLRSTVAGAGRQAIQQENLGISRADNKALAEIFGHGLSNPADLRDLIDEIGYQQARNPFRLGAKAKAAVAAKAGGTAAHAIIR